MNEYVVVRTHSAGAWIGRLVKRDGKEVELADARRLWFWSGASSLSELAVRGVSRPDKCKFPIPVPSIVLTEAIEVIPATEAAVRSIHGVKEWTQH